MLRSVTLSLQTVLRNNIINCENAIPMLQNSFRHSFSSVAVAPEIESQQDKLYKRIEIEVRGNDPAVLRSYGIFTCKAAEHLNITLEKTFEPKKSEKMRWTVLKSKAMHKKHRVQYEIRTYYRFMHFVKLTGSTADTFLEYIQRNLPEGVAMKVTKVFIKKSYSLRFHYIFGTTLLKREHYVDLTPTTY